MQDDYLVFLTASYLIAWQLINEIYLPLGNRICDALRDLVLFVQFKKREKHPWRSVTYSAKSRKAAYLLAC